MVNFYKMKKHIPSFLLLTFLAFGIFSCKKDDVSTVDMGYNYFPNEVGRYVIYNVDSIFYEDNNIDPTTHIAKADTFRFQLKEKIESTFLDNQNRPALRLERYVRFPDTANSYANSVWTLRNVWMENRTATTAEKVEDNVRYIRLSFPVKQFRTWNGNAQNTLTDWEYSYDYIDLPRSVAGHSFDSVLNVIQHQSSSAIDFSDYSEMYARNAGLIYKKVIDIQSQPPTSWATHPDSLASFINTPILNRATAGYRFTHSVNSYGIE